MSFLRLIFAFMRCRCARAFSYRGIATLAGALLAMLVAASAPAQINEYEVKSAFLFNFALFTQPIASTVAPLAPQPSSPYRICIYGKDPFGAAAKSLASRKIAGRDIMFALGVSLDELKTCQMVFIGETEREVVRRATAAVSGLPIITVAEVKEFPFTSVMFNLILVDEKVAFQVNTVAAKNQQLDISAKLIRLAKNVH